MENKHAPFHLNVSGKNIQITKSMFQAINDHLSKLERFSPKAIDAHVTLEVHKFENIVSIVLRSDHIKIKAQAKTDDMYNAIAAAFLRIENQLHKYKEKIQNHHHRSLATTDMLVNVITAPTNEEFNEGEDENETMNNPMMQVVSQERRILKMLTDEEAVMKMELSQDSFLIYKDEASQQLKVIYRRKDNNYGVIQVTT